MVGPAAIEIMEDLDGTGEVAKFIQRAGKGIMLISYNVDNCPESLELLKRNNVKLIDQKPRWFTKHKRNFAFIHPKPRTNNDQGLLMGSAKYTDGYAGIGISLAAGMPTLQHQLNQIRCHEALVTVRNHHCVASVGNLPANAPGLRPTSAKSGSIYHPILEFYLCCS